MQKPTYMNYQFAKTKNIPPNAYELTDRQLLKEQFYLNRFLYTLENNPNMPTLPDPSILDAIKEENNGMEETAQAFRTNSYDKYLQNKLLALKAQIGMSTQNSISQNYIYQKQAPSNASKNKSVTMQSSKSQLTYGNREGQFLGRK